MSAILNGANVAVVIFFIGLAGLVLRKNMMMTVISISIMNVAVILGFVTMNASTDSVAPMIANTVAEAADPVPQALMITSVVLGVAVQAMALVLILDIYRSQGTIDWVQAKFNREGRADQVVEQGLAGPIWDWRATCAEVCDLFTKGTTQ
jgi:multicomponent Na+:H+ antiporter subunit C